MRSYVHTPYCSSTVLVAQPVNTVFMGTQARLAMARNVRALRQKLDLSQAKLSKRCGVAQTAISYIDR